MGERLLPLALRYLVGGSRVGFLWGRARLELHDRPGAKQTARARSLNAESIYDGDLAVRALQMVHGLSPLSLASVSRPAPAALEAAILFSTASGCRVAPTTKRGRRAQTPGPWHRAKLPRSRCGGRVSRSPGSSTRGEPHGDHDQPTGTRCDLG